MIQQTLDLRRTPAFSASDFLPAACNQAAIGWMARWPAWPSFALALCGPQGSGKTHLAHIFAARSESLVLTDADISDKLLADLPDRRGVVVEDADRGVDETQLFHLFNRLQEGGRPLLLTGRSPPSRWRLMLPDLRSRLASVPVAQIGAPDDDLLAALLVKLFADRQIRIAPDVTRYLISRIERSFAAHQDMVDRLDQAALAAHRPVTVPLIRALLE